MRVWRGMLLSHCMVLLTLAGCSKAPEPTAPASTPAGTADTSSPPSAAPAPAELPAESGLAVKRGVVTLAPDRSSFRPCGEQKELLMIDQTDGVLKREFAGEKNAESAEHGLKLYIEAYGERAIDQPAPEGFAGTFMLEEALYAAPDGQTRGCDSPPQDYIVAARGNEPFWSAQVTEAALLWSQPEEPREISIAAPQMQNSEGAVSYVAASAEHKIELLIEAQGCRDDMSGEYFAYSARATLDGKKYAGCARIGGRTF